MAFQKATRAAAWIRNLISGYIRDCDTKQTIPTDIYNLCILYFMPKDRFLVHGELILIKSSGSDVDCNDIACSNQLTLKNTKNGWNTIYGEFVITNNYKSIIKWIIRVDVDYCAIGIDSSNHEQINSFASRSNKHEHYIWYGHLGEFYLLKDMDTTGTFKFKRGDQVQVKLNVNERKLIFNKNNEDKGKEVYGIDMTKEYRLVVSILYNPAKTAKENGTVQINDFEIL